MSIQYSTQRIIDLYKSLEEPQNVWTSINPVVASKKSSIYEARSVHWKSIINLQSKIILLIQNLINASDEITEEELKKSTECANAAEIALAELRLAQNNLDLENEYNNQIEQTKDILITCPKIIKNIKKQYAQLIDEIKYILETYDQYKTNINKGLEEHSNWMEYSQKLKYERDGVLAELNEAKKRIEDITNTNLSSLSGNIKKNLEELELLKSNRNSLVEKDIYLNNILAETHGIMVPEESIENLGNISDYLQYEEDVLVEYYEAKLQRYSRIYNIESIKYDDGTIGIVCIPRPNWLQYFIKPDFPTLTQIEIIYANRELYPKDISIKINTGKLAKSNFNNVITGLTKKIQFWKSKMLKSSVIDLYSLINFFI